MDETTAARTAAARSDARVDKLAGFSYKPEAQLISALTRRLSHPSIGVPRKIFLGMIFLVMTFGKVMEFFDALVRYEVALWSALEDELGRRGLTSLGQLHALRIVERYRGRARVQDLSSEIGITVGAASKLVDRLERDGLATRAPNPTNRRSSLIVLTETGQDALTAALQVCVRSVARAVGDEDTKPLTAALDRLQRRLPASGPGVAA